MSTAPRAVAPSEAPVCPAEIPAPGWTCNSSHASESDKNPLASEREEEAETDSEYDVVEERPE
eukprot:983496-Pyramimonas_sp.AAC.1